MRESFVSTEDKNKSELERGIINCQSQIDNGKVCLSEMNETLEVPRRTPRVSVAWDSVGLYWGCSVQAILPSRGYVAMPGLSIQL